VALSLAVELNYFLIVIVKSFLGLAQAMITGTSASHTALAACFQSDPVKSSGDLPITTTAVSRLPTNHLAHTSNTFLLIFTFSPNVAGQSH